VVTLQRLDIFTQPGSEVTCPKERGGTINHTEKHETMVSVPSESSQHDLDSCSD